MDTNKYLLSLSFCVFVLIFSTKSYSQRISLVFFVDRTNPMDLRYWTEKENDAYYPLVEKIPLSRHFYLINLKNRLAENKIKSMKISNDSTTFAAINFIFNDTSSKIDISYNYNYYIQLSNYLKKTTVLFNKQSIVEKTILTSTYDTLTDSTTTHYFFDNNNKILKSISKSYQNNELVEKISNYYEYDDHNNLKEIKAYKNDTLKFYLIQQNYKDSIVQFINGIKSKKIYITQTFTPDEKILYFEDEFVIVHKIEYYNHDAVNSINTIKINNWGPNMPQILMYEDDENGSVERIINYESHYFRLYKHWKLDPHLILDSYKWGCVKKYFSPTERDFIVYLKESLLTDVRSGLIMSAHYSIIDWDSEIMKYYRFVYKYEYY